MNQASKLTADWTPPVLPADMMHGDMPGDRIQIEPQHIRKADTLFPHVRAELAALLDAHPQHRAVIGICGGSGVGKSEIASVLGEYLKQLGVGAYILSGDNYPHRIPRDNDLERQRVYRTGGLRGLLMSGCYREDQGPALRELWQAETDADPRTAAERPWMAVYQQAAERSLDAYLGTPAEIDFEEVNGIISAFKNGADRIPLKRMGREPEALWYSPVDFTGTQVLIIEWTHSNSDYLRGVDLPILLNSTPAETLAHRRARARDGKTDSAFTTTVLRLEQTKLEHQAHKAKIIISKNGEILSYAQYRRLMAEEVSA